MATMLDHATPAFTIETVARLAGLSVDRLRRWDVTGFFHPSYALPDRRKPHSRIYSFEDVVGLLAIARLFDLGVSHRRMRAIVPELQKLTAEPQGEKRLLVVDGEVVFDQGGEGMAGSVVDLAAIDADARDRVRRLSERTADQIGKVTRDRYVMGGEPVIAGTPIPVATILDFVRHGYSPREIVASYPRLTEADVSAVVDQIAVS